jgi:hypothetical protein
MAVILADFKQPVVGPNGGSFRARACALPTRGTWQGWIEFNPLNGDPTFRSPRETVQPTRTDVAHWATGLTPHCLAGALDRALDRLSPLPRIRH